MSGLKVVFKLPQKQQKTEAPLNEQLNVKPLKKRKLHGEEGGAPVGHQSQAPQSHQQYQHAQPSAPENRNQFGAQAGPRSEAPQQANNQLRLHIKVPQREITSNPWNNGSQQQHWSVEGPQRAPDQGGAPRLKDDHRGRSNGGGKRHKDGKHRHKHKEGSRQGENGQRELQATEADQREQGHTWLENGKPTPK